MAIKKRIKFALAVVGDGSSRTITVALASGPVSLIPPQGGGGTYTLSPDFSLAASLPTGVTGVASYNGKTVSATIAVGIVTFTYDVGQELDSGEEDILYGTLTF